MAQLAADIFGVVQQEILQDAAVHGVLCQSVFRTDGFGGGVRCNRCRIVAPGKSDQPVTKLSQATDQYLRRIAADIAKGFKSHLRQLLMGDTANAWNFPNGKLFDER